MNIVFANEPKVLIEPAMRLTDASQTELQRSDLYSATNITIIKRTNEM